MGKVEGVISGKQGEGDGERTNLELLNRHILVSLNCRKVLVASRHILLLFWFRIAPASPFAQGQHPSNEGTSDKESVLGEGGTYSRGQLAQEGSLELVPPVLDLGRAVTVPTKERFLASQFLHHFLPSTLNSYSPDAQNGRTRHQGLHQGVQKIS